MWKTGPILEIAPLVTTFIQRNTTSQNSEWFFSTNLHFKLTIPLAKTVHCSVQHVSVNVAISSNWFLSCLTISMRSLQRRHWHYLLVYWWKVCVCACVSHSLSRYIQHVQKHHPTCEWLVWTEGWDGGWHWPVMIHGTIDIETRRNMIKLLYIQKHLEKNININQRLCIIVIINWELCLTINHLDPSNSISMRLENTTRIKLFFGTSIPWWHLHLLLQALQSSKKTHVGGMPGHQAEFGTPYWKFPNIKWEEVSASFLSQILWFNKNIINQMESALLLLSVWSLTPRIYTLHQNQWNQQLVCVCVTSMDSIFSFNFSSLSASVHEDAGMLYNDWHRLRWCQSAIGGTCG